MKRSKQSSNSSQAGTSSRTSRGKPADKDDDLNVRITLSDLKTLEESIKSLKESPRYGVYYNGVNGGQYKDDKISVKPLDQGSTTWDKIIGEDGSLQPRYTVNCCGSKYSSAAGLFAHLRKVHKVGLPSSNKTSCKLCGELVCDDLQMLHVELMHDHSPAGEQKILFTKMEIEGKCQSVMLLEPT